MKFNLFSFLSSIIICCSLVSCAGGEKFKFEEGIAWNTVYHITYDSDKDLSDSILYVLGEIDSSLSPFNQNSTVSKINDNRSDLIDGHILAVYNLSRKINSLSDGAFDPTLGPVIRAWGFGQGHEISSDTLRLDSLLQFVGISKTAIQDHRLIKNDPRIEFNFSALAKGYGVDCIADMLKRNGVRNFLVEVGGEIRAEGHNPDKNKWSVGIDRPDSESKAGDIVNKIFITDGAVATSGNYRNYHESGNGRFGHTISPATGRPITSDVISATVIAPTCMEADALATTCMVVGSEEALSLCTKLRAGVMLIKSDLSIVTNPAFESFMTEN